MRIRTRLVEYQQADTVFAGILTWDDDQSGPRPGVLVCHTIRGRTELEERRARMLAELGYVALAADVYGKEHVGSGDANTRAQMDKLKADRPLLQERLSLALDALSSQDEVNENQVAAIGFCFGGLCVLDMARMNMRVSGVVSFHGLFESPPNADSSAINARVLVLHGWDDPLATPDKILSLAEELSGKGADWQIHGYGNTQHAFTNPNANDSSQGTVYNELADRRSWKAMQNFLSELFSG